MQNIKECCTCLASRGAFEVWEHPGESAGPFIFKGFLFVNSGKTAILGQFASPRGIRLTKIKGLLVHLAECSPSRRIELG